MGLYGFWVWNALTIAYSKYRYDQLLWGGEEKEIRILFAVNAVLFKEEKWKFALDIQLTNNGTTVRIVWIAVNGTAFKYANEPKGYSHPLQYIWNYCAINEYTGKIDLDRTPIMSPHAGAMFGCHVTKAGFESEPSDLWGTIMVAIIEPKKEIITYDFHVSDLPVLSNFTRDC